MRERGKNKEGREIKEKKIKEGIERGREKKRREKMVTKKGKEN